MLANHARLRRGEAGSASTGGFDSRSLTFAAQPTSAGGQSAGCRGFETPHWGGSSTDGAAQPAALVGGAMGYEDLYVEFEQAHYIGVRAGGDGVFGF